MTALVLLPGMDGTGDLSFSGPIALSIAARQPPLLRGVVLCCSFATNPRPGLGAFPGLVNLLPGRPPLRALEWLLAGRFATPQLRQGLSTALAQVSVAVLRGRMAAVIGVDVVPVLPSVTVPVLYLRAAEDRLVPASASQLIVRNVPHARVVDVVAPHFLLQAATQEAARLVDDFLLEVA